MSKLFLIVFFSIIVSQAGAHEDCSSLKIPRLEQSFQVLEDYEYFSVSDHDIANAKCVKPVPTNSEMEAWLNKYAGEKKENRKEPGIEFKDESPELLKLFDKLTTSEAKVKAKVDSQCTKVLCAVKEIFGDEEGPQMLYLLGKYGLNGSALSYEERSFWMTHELRPALQALEDMPEGLLPLGDNKQFSRFKRGQSLKIYEEMESHGGCVRANSNMTFFDCAFANKPREQTRTTYHELSHHVAEQLGLDESKKWLEISGWEEMPMAAGGASFNSNWEASNEACLISKYGSTNPHEDFAESMVAYRYNPERLKGQCPEKYKFLKDRVYKGIEYTSVKACQGKKIPSGSLKRKSG
ncbi:hypothetical protein D3C87_257720 [compost metagenome]